MSGTHFLRILHWRNEYRKNQLISFYSFQSLTQGYWILLLCDILREVPTNSSQFGLRLGCLEKGQWFSIFNTPVLIEFCCCNG